MSGERMRLYELRFVMYFTVIYSLNSISVTEYRQILQETDLSVTLSREWCTNPHHQYFQTGYMREMNNT